MTVADVQAPSLAGTAVTRVDAVDKVTGRALYTSDLHIAGMGFAALVRSPVPHAVIRRIDTSAVSPQVTTLHGGELGDLDPYYGELILDQPLLAIERVRYVGEPVAGVVADTPRAAREAVEAIEVDYAELPALTTPESALGSATCIHPRGDRPANVCYEARFEHGDVDAALASAAYVHHGVYTFPSAFHFAMEPFACVASWGPDGLDVWAGTQQPFKVRADLARIFGLRLTQVRVRVPYVGGGYGAKGQAKYEPVVAALARKAGRPVKFVADMGEAFLTIRRHAATVRITTGTDASGRIVARDIATVFDTGAYADKGPRVASCGAYRAAGPYAIENVRSTAVAVYTNTIPAGAFRGFSTPQVAWAGESSIDEIAEHFGEDPLAFRLRQLARRGDPFLHRSADALALDADLAQGLRTAADTLHWGSPVAAGRGRGVAVGVKDGGGGSSSYQADVRLEPDGAIEVLVGTSELGQGSRTVFAQLAADVLGAGIGEVSVRFGDTALAPFDAGTNASRSTVGVGSAVMAAARDLAGQLQDVARAALPGSGEVSLDAGDLVAGGDRCRLRTALARWRGIHEGDVSALVGHGWHEPAARSPATGSPSMFYEVGHTAAEVSVDRDTGQVRLEQLVSVADVGFAINPVTAEGQDEGSVMMAIGHTFFEDVAFDGGEPSNADLTEYRVPRADDVGAGTVRSVLLENCDGPGPFGAKGAGEGGIIAVSPAIANALRAAAGVRIRDLPLTPERVWRALAEQEAQEAGEAWEARASGG